MKSVLPVAALAGLLFVGSASAQQSYTDVDDDVEVTDLGTTVDSLEDMNVYNAAGQQIGEINEVLGSDNRTPAAVGVDFDDDIASGDRVVQFDTLSMNGDRLTISLDNAAIAKLPQYND